MSDKPFVSGDTVTLKSGGPAMTVEWCEDELGTMTAYCVWFDDKNTQQGSKFAAAALKKIDV